MVSHNKATCVPSVLMGMWAGCVSVHVAHRKAVWILRSATALGVCDLEQASRLPYELACALQMLSGTPHSVS